MATSLIPRLRVRATSLALSSPSVWIRRSLGHHLAALSTGRCASSTSSPSGRPSGRVLQKDSRLFDEAIPHRTISLVDPETSSLLPPAKLSSILASLDRTRFSILLVDPSKPVPICKILDKKAEWDKKQAAKKQSSPGDDKAGKSKSKSTASAPPKEVHLTWGVTAHDLSHKLSKARELLSKGSKVTVILKDKKGAERVSSAVKDQVMGDVESSLGGSGKCLKKGQRGGLWSLEFVAV